MNNSNSRVQVGNDHEALDALDALDASPSVGARTPLRHRFSVRLGIAVLGIAGLTASGAAAASGPDQIVPIGISAKVDRSGQLRGNHRAITVPVRIWCSESTVGTIDAVLEQRSTQARSIRSVAVNCDPGGQRIDLVFETKGRFEPETARIHMAVSAGFAEQFSLMQLAPATIRVKG